MLTKDDMVTMRKMVRLNSTEDQWNNETVETCLNHIDAQAARIAELESWAGIAGKDFDGIVCTYQARIATLEADREHARQWAREWKHRSLDEPGDWPPELASDGWSGELTDKPTQRTEVIT